MYFELGFSNALGCGSSLFRIVFVVRWRRGLTHVCRYAPEHSWTMVLIDVCRWDRQVHEMRRAITSLPSQMMLAAGFCTYLSKTPEVRNCWHATGLWGPCSCSVL
jgi:hypothetical protein